MHSPCLAKSHVNIVFVGHVDAGKSTLGGQLLYLTDMVDKRTMEKYEREAKEAGRETWYLSWALDSTTQERAKVRFLFDAYLIALEILPSILSTG